MVIIEKIPISVFVQGTCLCFVLIKCKMPEPIPIQVLQNIL